MIVPDASLKDGERVAFRKITTTYLQDALVLDSKIMASDVNIEFNLFATCSAKYAVLWKLDKMTPIGKVIKLYILVLMIYSVDVLLEVYIKVVSLIVSLNY